MRTKKGREILDPILWKSLPPCRHTNFSTLVLEGPDSAQYATSTGSTLQGGLRTGPPPGLQPPLALVESGHTEDKRPVTS